MARDIKYRKPSMLFCMRLKICLGEDLYGFLAGIHLDFDRRILKIYLMALTIFSANDRMRHFLPRSEGTMLKDTLLALCRCAGWSVGNSRRGTEAGILATCL